MERWLYEHVVDQAFIGFATFLHTEFGKIEDPLEVIVFSDKELLFGVRHISVTFVESLSLLGEVVPVTEHIQFVGHLEEPKKLFPKSHSISPCGGPL